VEKGRNHGVIVRSEFCGVSRSSPSRKLRCFGDGGWKREAGTSAGSDAVSSSVQLHKIEHKELI
jgi:hypothetical protein